MTKNKQTKATNSPTTRYVKFFKNPFVWLLIGILTFANYHYGAIWLEKRQFEKLDRQAYQYIQSINQKYPGKVSREQSCHYSSAKFSKGTLSCEVDSRISKNFDSHFDKKLLLNFAKHNSQMLAWGNFNERMLSLYPDEMTDDIYLNFSNTKGCSVSVYFDTDRSLIIARCSGNAKAEHYPVREH